MDPLLAPCRFAYTLLPDPYTLDKSLVTDSLPALALSVEPAEGNVMSRPPRPPKETIFAHGLGIHALWVGLLMGGIVLFAQAWAINTEHVHWQTIVFTVLCLTQLGHVLAIRSGKRIIV